MTEDDKALLEAHLDEPVEITLVSGERQMIRPVILVDEPPTPDLFFLELDADGKPVGTAGRSILLEDVASVRLPE